ncbi:MAG: hypothetical protein WC499_02580 [Patescibacteria group bacterium]
MRRFTRKSIVEKSHRFRNEQAILKIVEREEKIRYANSFYGQPKEFKDERKSRNPFKIGSLFIPFLP